jgi:hypothetical protein
MSLQLRMLSYIRHFLIGICEAAENIPALSQQKTGIAEGIHYAHDT